MIYEVSLHIQNFKTMRFYRLAISFSIITVLFSCEPNQKALNEIKRTEVIAIHDVVMPKIGELKKFEKEAEKQIELLEMEEVVDSSKVQEFKDLAVELNQAYDAMFVWMRQYKVEDEGKSPEEIKVYLEEQEKLIAEVNDQIKTVLAKSEELLTD